MSIFTTNQTQGDASEKTPQGFMDQIVKAAAKDSSWFEELQNKVYEQMKANDEKNKQAELDKRIKETEKQFEEEYRQSHLLGDWDQGDFAEIVTPVTESIQRDNKEINNYINKNLFG